ncbi:putative type VI secretion system effector [Chitinivorax sp. B]|uniref:putative type VI secretion system effector n=1 Tax=Chitinivorax sp. B TaxID=2502235 RepID=UPI0010F9C75E|nr:putative type VI secretion system effector [Chitinivorax sp. B]
MDQTSTTGLQKFSGRLAKLSCERTDESFVMTSGEQSAMGGVAVAAAMVEAVGQAATTALAASDPSEPADWVEFELDGKSFKGWLWRCPFRTGDEVEVVAANEGSFYRVYAVARPSDRLVALYPHCSRGRVAHWLNALKVFLLALLGTPLYIGCMLSLGEAAYGIEGWPLYVVALGALFLLAPLSFLFFGKKGPLFFIFLGWLPVILQYQPAVKSLFGDPTRLLDITAIIFGLSIIPALHLSWKWMEFVRLAEEIFRAFGWANPTRIDLVARAKATPLDCKASNIPDDDFENDAIVTDLDYGSGFYRY